MFLIHRLMFAIISMDNLIELLEASTPFQGNVSVKELIASLNITSGINLKPIKDMRFQILYVSMYI